MQAPQGPALARCLRILILPLPIWAADTLIFLSYKLSLLCPTTGPSYMLSLLPGMLTSPLCLINAFSSWNCQRKPHLFRETFPDSVKLTSIPTATIMEAHRLLTISLQHKF